MFVYVKKIFVIVGFVIIYCNAQSQCGYGDEITYGNGSWIGYVYNNGECCEDPPQWLNYAGYVTEAAQFDRNVGIGNWTGATNSLCTNVNENFSVRYKMTYYFTPGIYQFTIGGDDGVRLSLDGGSTWLVSGWYAHGYTEFNSSNICLSGTYNMVFEFYDDSNDARCKISWNTIEVPPITPIANPNPICLGQSTNLSVNSTVGGNCTYSISLNNNYLGWEGGYCNVVVGGTTVLSNLTGESTQNFSVSQGQTIQICYNGDNCNYDSENRFSVYSGPNGTGTALLNNQQCGSTQCYTITNSCTATSYNWYTQITGGAAFGTTTGNNTVPVTPNQAGQVTYYVSTASQEQCSEVFPRVPIIVQVVAGTVEVTPSEPVLTCAEPSINVTADLMGGNGTNTYSWSNGLGGNPNAIIIQPGTYSVTVSSAGCTGEASFEVGENTTPPNINIINSTETTVLSCSTFEINVTAVGGVSYVWSGGITPNSATNTFYMPGSYTVTATAANGCTSSSTITITFQVDMYIVDTSYSNVLCYGANDGNIIVQFQGGFPPFQYQWSDGATTLNRNNIGSGIYTLTITDFYGCTLSETFTISEPPQLLISDTSYNHLSCFESNDGNISVSITGGTLPYTVIWNDNTSSLYRNNLSSGIYAVTIIDAHNCFVMEQFIITQPEAMSIVTGNNQIICEGSSVILQAQVQGGTMPYTYYWSETPTPNDYTTGNYARQVTPATTTTYRVYVTDAKGCQTTVDSTKIIVSPYIVIDSLKIKDNSCYHSCDGEATVYYHGGTIPINLSWASPNNTLHDLCVGQYSLTMTDQYGCSTSTSFFIDEPYELVSSTYSVPTRCYGSSDGIAEVYLQGGTQPYTYLWYDGTTTSRITVSAGYYEVTIYDANHCRLTSGFNITEPTALISAPLHSQTICYGQNISLQTNSSGGTPPYDYHWTDNQGNEHFGNIWNVTPIDTTIYTVTVSDANNCSLTLNPATININGKLEILSLVADQPIICPGYDCEIRADVRGGNGGPYMMRLQDGRIVGSPFIVSPTETTTYYITVDDMCGTIPVIDSITIEVRPNPTINFIPSVYAGCPPLEMEFTYQSDYDFESYFWLFGNNSYSAEKNSHHTYIESGIYDVTLEVTDALGCVHKKTLKDLITVYPLPQASFSFTPEIATTVSPEVTFVNHSNGAIAYYWNLGDGDSSRNEHPIHNYMPSVNSYEVCLIAETNHLCRDTACREVKVEDLTALYFPNSFTPDGDGINDCFKPCGNFISQKDFHLTVIDRFGEVVFESDKYDDTEKATDCSECSEHAWNGKMKNTGNVLQNGIYIWQCIYKDGYGIRYEKTGHVLLVR